MTERPKLEAISPCFIVSHVPRAIDFYQNRLGFEIRFADPAEQPFFAIVGREGVQIFLKSVPEVAAQPNPTRHKWAAWDAFIYVANPDALVMEFADRGLAFHREITDRPDGVRGFEVSDRDGYVLFFGRPNDRPSQ